MYPEVQEIWGRVEIEVLKSNECQKILEYMKNYPTFYFHSARLSRVFGTSSYKMSKILNEMHKAGMLEKYVRGKRHPFSCYRVNQQVRRQSSP